MATHTYWLADPDGTLAPARGAAERDRLAELGWVVAAEPKAADRVWHHNAEIHGWTAFTVESLPAWEARGWVAAVPPMQQGDAGSFVALPEPGVPTPAPEPLAEPGPESAADPDAEPQTSDRKKEKDRA